jgi:carbonic anhydrase
LIEAFSDPYVDVRHSMQRLEITPFISHKELIRGFVYDVTSGRLVEVERAS